MKHVTTFAVCLLGSFGAQAQLRVSPLAPAAVPATFKRTDRMVQALHYTHRTGTYTVLATQSSPAPDPAAQASDGQRADLYAYHYPTSGPTPTWQLHDLAADCPLDIAAEYAAGQ